MDIRANYSSVYNYLKTVILSYQAGPKLVIGFQKKEGTLLQVTAVKYSNEFSNLSQLGFYIAETCIPSCLTFYNSFRYGYAEHPSYVQGQ